MGGWQDGARQGDWWAARLADDLAGASKQLQAVAYPVSALGRFRRDMIQGGSNLGGGSFRVANPSPAMLRPDSRDLLIRGKFATQNLSVRFCKVGVFFRGQLDRWLIHTGELQQDAGKFVLHAVRKDGHRFHGLFEQSGHAPNIAVLGSSGSRPIN
jgi:hypothetical protein